MRKKAQSEMVGFAIIIILVAVIILVFLAISMNKPRQDYSESKEVANFLNAMLDYTTECETSYLNYVSLKNLIDKCLNEEFCLNERNSCEVLDETIEDLLSYSWKVGPEWPTKGYNLNITSEGKMFRNFQKGNITKDSRGSLQSYDGGLNIFFVVYY